MFFFFFSFFFLPRQRLISGGIVSVDDGFLLSDAVAHLIRNKETLQKLHLAIPLSRQQTTTRNSRHLIELLANLNSFPVLRHLLLSSELIYNDNSAAEAADDDRFLTRFLPPSLASLQLVVADEMGTGVLPCLAAGLLHLAQAVSWGQFPKLKCISCINTKQRLDGYGLDVMFASAGVHFGYDCWPSTYGRARRRVGSRAGSSSRSTTLASSDDEHL